MDNFTVQRLLMALAAANNDNNAAPEVAASTITATVPSEETAAKKKVQKRCGFSECKHKLALSDMECKCGVRHCSKHRMPEDHACAFDFKAHDRAVLGKQLVACVGDKIDRRI
jgi:hypothetical protein